MGWGGVEANLTRPMHTLPPTVAAARRDCPRESSQCLSQGAFSADQRLAELFLLQLGQISCHLGAADAAAAAVVVVLCVCVCESMREIICVYVSQVQRCAKESGPPPPHPPPFFIFCERVRLRGNVNTG